MSSAKKACKKFHKNKKKYKKCIQHNRAKPAPPAPPAPPELTWVELYADTAQMDQDGVDSIVPDTFDLPETCVGDIYLTALAPQPTRADETYSPALEYLLSTSVAKIQVRRVGASSGVQVNLDRSNTWAGRSTGAISNGGEFGGRFVLTVDSFYNDDGAHSLDYWNVEFSMSARCTPDTPAREL